MTWPHGESSLQNFLHHLNSFHHTIKFQHEKSNKSIQFLDTTVHITPQRSLETTLHIKPTDKGLLLHSSSHHSSSCKMGTIYSQALRYRRITTDDDKLLQHLRRLHKILLARGYQHSTIQKTFNKIIPFTRKELLHQKNKQTNQPTKQKSPTICHPLRPLRTKYHRPVTQKLAPDREGPSPITNLIPRKTNHSLHPTNQPTRLTRTEPLWWPKPPLPTQNKHDQ